MTATDRSLPTGAGSHKGALPPGTQLNGIYQIDAFIRSGGMGEVYRGHEILTESPVAIKLIRDELSGDEMALAMFRNEATALNRLHHEAIVRYFLFSLDPILMRHYLAMEFVEGHSLSELLKQGPLSIEDTHTLMRRVALGLQAAHHQKVIHRDVTPDNIIIPEGGIAEARIIDFGIARSTRVGDKTVIGGGFAGKFSYVSPEQLGMFGGDVRPASDIYSLGLVLAQCLRGSPLEMGATEYEVIEKRRDVPDISDIDPAMRQLIHHMLQPDPAMRPASMAEVAAWPLRAGAEQATIFSPVTPRPRTSAPSGPRSTPSPPAETSSAPASAYASEPSSTPSWKPGSTPPPHGATGATGGAKVEEPRNRGMLIGGGAALLLLAGAAFFLIPRGPAPAPRPVETEPSKPPEAAAADPTLAIRRNILGFDGGDCFFAAPGVIQAGSAEIDGYGRSKETFDALDESFKKANGFEAQINVREVTLAQCPALAFVHRFAPKEDDLFFDLPRTNLQRSGDLLRGAIDTRMHQLRLLIVDADGGVHDVSDKMAGDGVRRDFAMTLRKEKPSALLLIGVAAEQPIPAPAGKAMAKEYFADLASRMSDSAQTAHATLKYIKME